MQADNTLRVITKNVLLINDKTDNRYLMPKTKMHINAAGEIDLMEIVEELRSFPITGATIFYYDSKNNLFISMGKIAKVDFIYIYVYIHIYIYIYNFFLYFFTPSHNTDFLVNTSEKRKSLLKYCVGVCEFSFLFLVLEFV